MACSVSAPYLRDMANERNVTELEKLLRELDPQGQCFGIGGHTGAAQWLASRGVLASGCVTDDEARDVLQRAVPLVPAGTALTRDGSWLRSALEQIARGEA
jgi:hypothetical protein